MKTSLSSKQLSLAAACALALGFASVAVAQDVSRMNPNDRELWENSTKTIWKSGFGLCWHSGYGPPPGYTECNPAPVAQVVAPRPPAPAPVYVAPPPPAPVIAPAPAPLPPRQTRG
jgi:OOP family OmpA-OmpF porin